MSSAEALSPPHARSKPPAPLGGQDLAFLAWESRNRPMHIGIVARFRVSPGAAAPDLEALREVLAPRIANEPLLSSRLTRRRFRRPEWDLVAEPCLTHHVRCVEELPPAGARGTLRRDRILAAPLDPDRPLWEIWLDPEHDDAAQFTLLIKLHHVLIDGIAAVALLERLLGGDEGVTRPLPPRSPDPAPRGPAILSTLRFALELCRPGLRSPLNGHVARARRHRHLELSARALKQARLRWGASGNDLLLAAVTGALRAWLADRGVALGRRPLRAFVPVNLRHGPERGASGNRIAPWLVPLPFNTAERDGRVRATRDATRALRTSQATRGGAGMAGLIERAGGWLAKLGMAIAAGQRAFGLVVTNVPGPRAPVQLLGGRLESLHAHPPLFPGQRVCVAAVHYDGRVCIGLNDAFGNRQLGTGFAAALAQELDLLLSSAEGVPGTNDDSA